MPRSEGRVETAHAGRYLAQLCGHFAYRSPTRWDGRRGLLEFGWGRCTLLATTDALLLLAEAVNEPALGRVEYLVTDHTERLGAGESLSVAWTRADPPPYG